MLKPPRLHGAQHLQALIEFLGVDHACRLIDVHPTTMRRWLRGKVDVPQAALQALYWLTPYGFSDAFSESHITHQILIWKLRLAESAAHPGQTVMEPAMPANDVAWNALRPRRLRLVSASDPAF